MVHEDGTRQLVFRNRQTREMVYDFYKPADGEGDYHSSLAGYSLRLANYFEGLSGQRLLYSYPSQLIKCDDVARIKLFVHENPEYIHASRFIKTKCTSAIRCVDAFINVNGPQKPQPQRICMGCSMKISKGKNRAQSCVVR
jgi:hypothetical protein